MSQPVVCSGCEKEFIASEHDEGMWLICPHCGGRTPNPAAVDKQIMPTVAAVNRAVESHRPGYTLGLIGAVLVMFGGVGAILFGFDGFSSLPPFRFDAKQIPYFFSFLAILFCGCMLLCLAQRARHNNRPKVTRLDRRKEINSSPSLLRSVGALLVVLGRFALVVGTIPAFLAESIFLVLRQGDGAKGGPGWAPAIVCFGSLALMIGGFALQRLDHNRGRISRASVGRMFLLIVLFLVGAFGGLVAACATYVGLGFR